MSDGSLRARLAALVSGVRFGKFVSVGAIGAVCDTALLVTLVEAGGLRPEVANLLSIEAAILVMFVLNERWTFARAGTGGPVWRRLVRSHAVRAGGSTVQYVIFVVLINAVAITYRFAGVDLWLLAAKAAGIGCGMLVNYAFESLFTWRVHLEDG